MKTLTLPWPPSALNPNSHSRSWKPRHFAGVKYKRDCGFLAKSMRPVFPDGYIHLTLTFHPPTVRNRDEDNLVAAMKSGLDGVAEAWGVNDTRFKLTIQRGHMVKHGAVIVEFEEAP